MKTYHIVILIVISTMLTIFTVNKYDQLIRFPALREAFEQEAVNTNYAQFNKKTRQFEWRNPEELSVELNITHPAASLFGDLPTKTARN